MKIPRLGTALITAALAAALAFSQSPLDRKPRSDQGPSRNGPKQERKPSGPPPRREDPGQRPSNSGPRPRNDDRKPSSPPDIRPRNDERKPSSPPDVRPRNDERKPSSPPEVRPRNDDRKPSSPPEVRPRNEGQRPNTGPDIGPRPRNEGQKPPETGPRPGSGDPRPSDEYLRPRPRPNQGGGPSNGPGNGQGNGPGNGSLGRNDDRRPQTSGQSGPGRWNSDNPLGRINDGRTNQDRPGDNLIGRRGGNAYGGSVSNANRGDGRQSRPSYDRAPVDIFRGSLGSQVRREDNVRISNRNWRVGYYHYRRDWCDDNFWFGYYVFDPYRYNNCYVSPWYYYPHLPGYVNYRCATVLSISIGPFHGTVYNWYRPARWDDYSWRSYSSIDYALEDITRAWENVDRRALRRLIPYRDRIAIFVDGRYNYSMTAEDFEDFMIDAVEGTRTERYTITRVERRGREAEVTARHDYVDPYGYRETVYHWYRLEEDRGNYVIRRFGTSYYPNY